ncbi:hypothetical protein THRCLA_10075, partial [Thraustotheca clavata]
GFLEYAMMQLSAFTKGKNQQDEDAINNVYKILLMVAAVIEDEDNCVHAAQLGMHLVVMRLLMHENELIQEGASAIVVNSSSKNANTSGINTSFPYKTLPLEPPTREWPLLQALPHDVRDDENDEQVVLIRAVKTRMTGQPKTGYLLWGAAVILARWIHLNRQLFHGQTVLEVGSGLGLCGIVAAAYSDQITLTDYQQDTLDALQYNVNLNTTSSSVHVEHLDWDNHDLTLPKVDIVMASDIICEASTAEGFANVIRHRLKKDGVAYLVNATSHSRFGVVHLQKLLKEPPFLTTIVPVDSLPEGRAALLDTVWDANELKYEHYTIRLDPSHTI